MECHKCEVAADIGRGRYRSKPWKDVPCSKCSASIGVNHHGRSHVAIYSSAEPVEAGIDLGEDRTWIFPERPNVRVEAIPRAKAKIIADLPFFEHLAIAESEPERETINSRLAYLAKGILSLAPRTREIVLERLAYPDKPLRLIAGRIGISISSTHNRLKKARRDWPALAIALTMKTWTNRPSTEDLAFPEHAEIMPANRVRAAAGRRRGTYEPEESANETRRRNGRPGVAALA